MRTAYQSGSSYQASSSYQSGSQAQGARQEGNVTDQSAERDFFLRYASLGGNSTVISGSSDLGMLSGLKEAILKLKSDLSSSTSFVIKGDERTDFDKRFLLFEHQLDGLLHRGVSSAGGRSLDYTTMLTEKENQIVELERKITSLEERLKRSNAREVELENKITQLNSQLLSAKDRSLSG